MYDVVIVGGSFGGLAAAIHPRVRRVPIVDNRPIGSHETSSRGAPLSVA